MSPTATCSPCSGPRSAQAISSHDVSAARLQGPLRRRRGHRHGPGRPAVRFRVRHEVGVRLPDRRAEQPAGLQPHRQHPGRAQSRRGIAGGRWPFTHPRQRKGNRSHGSITSVETATRTSAAAPRDLAGEHQHAYLMATPGSGSARGGQHGHGDTHVERHVERWHGEPSTHFHDQYRKAPITRISFRRTGCTPIPPRSWPITSTSSTWTAVTRTRSTGTAGGATPMLVLSPVLTDHQDRLRRDAGRDIARRPRRRRGWWKRKALMASWRRSARNSPPCGRC